MGNEDRLQHHVAELIAGQAGGSGVVVELGVGEDAGPPDAFEQHGLQVARIDVGDLSTLVDRLHGVHDSLGQIRAVCLLDLLDRLAEPGRLLRLLAEYTAAHPAVLLVVSVANVGHRDVALGLLAGRWTSPVGDGPGGPGASAPVRFFTRETLATVLGQHGWQSVATYDLEGERSSQEAAEALLEAPTLAGDMVRQVGELFNPDARVRRFVWALRPLTPALHTLPWGPLIPTAPLPPEPTMGPLPSGLPTVPQAGEGELARLAVSILMRTQGRRNELLTEALYSAYAQTDDAYEVVLGFHNPEDTSGELRAGVERLVARLPAPLQRKIRLIDCPGEGRGAPLNTLLEAAEGLYASFLDDDDLLFDHHVETLVRGMREHGTAVLFQTFAAQRLIEPVATPALTPRPPLPQAGEGGHTLIPALSQGEREQSMGYPYTAVAMSIPWDRPFDPVAQHHHNLVPICCMAVPTQLVRQTSVRFRVDLDVGEDWDFWMGASQILRVVVLPEVTALINHWNDTTTNAMRRPDLAPLWQQVRDTRHRDHADVPLLLDGRIRPELQKLGRQPEELAWLRDQLAQRDARLKSIQRSRAWRLAGLLWRARGRVDRMLRHP